MSNKVRKALITIGVILILLSATYIGWRFSIIPTLAWEAGMVTLNLISTIILYGLYFLVPGIILLIFGIKKPRKGD